MKRKPALPSVYSPRKKRKYNLPMKDNTSSRNNSNNSNNSPNHNNAKMVCVICLTEMSSYLLHEHYAKYHPELLVSATPNYSNVIAKCAQTNKMVQNLNLIEDEEYKLKLEALQEQLKPKPQIKFNVPIFTLNGHGANDGGEKDKKRRKRKKKKKKKRETDGSSLTQALEHVTNNSASSWTGSASVITGNEKSEPSKYESIIKSLKKFETNTHPLSELLADWLLPTDVNNCRLMIKMLFEQLWNARTICDEQMLYIRYMNRIDAGNRIQLSLILNELKQNHPHLYTEFHGKIERHSDWQKWKQLRKNDDKIKNLRQNISDIKAKESVLRSGVVDTDVATAQENNISNLKNVQSALIQKYQMALKHSNPINNFFANYEKKKRSDLDPDIVDLTPNDNDNAKNNENGNTVTPTTTLTPQQSQPQKLTEPTGKDDDSSDDDEKWMVTVKKLLNEFKSSMDLREIDDKLESLRYCSEFDVLNDLLCINKVNNAQEIKRRFCDYFGNLSDWSFKRLIKWCQTNKFYQICQKIRSKQINGKQFIDIVTNITSVRRFFNNLTSPQVIQIYNRINHYFEDSLSIL